MKVFVVDDRSDVAEMIKDMFEDLGYKSEYTTDPAAAVEQVTGDPEIGLVVADVVMPVIMGPDLSKAVKAERPDVRVLLVSGFHTYRGVVDDYVLRKPFTKKQLRTAVREVMR
jgi:two-component system, cell cycle sensor histidine kinase and response regulator CckA